MSQDGLPAVVGSADGDQRKRATGAGAPCWCECGEVIPEGMRSTTRFVPGHKDGFHNRRAGADPVQAVGAPAAPGSLADAAVAAGEALAGLGQAARAAVEQAERSRQEVLEVLGALEDARGEVDRLRGEVRELCARLADLPPSTAQGETASDEPRRPTPPSSEAKAVSRALMVAVRAERARAAAAEAHTAAMLDQLGRIADRLIEDRTSTTTAPLPPAAPDATPIPRPAAAAAAAVPYRAGPPPRWSVTVPVADHSEEFGSLERLDDGGMLTVDEASALVTATAMRAARTLDATSELRRILTGKVRPEGLADEAELALEVHRRTLERLASQGLSDLAEPIVEGVLSYLGAQDVDDPDGVAV